MKNLLEARSFPFWIVTLSMIFALTLSQLIQDGVFMDGMLYISVSKNLADGMGTFWEPHFSKTSMTIFREQPPLYFGMLAALYKLLGSSMYVERLYAFICYVLTLLFMHKTWKVLFYNKPDIQKHSWLPILFYITIPVCFWSYANHVEETVMTLFATMSVFYSAKALFKNENLIVNIILAGICAFLSSLTKGVQGLFPIAAVFFFWLIKKDFSFKKNVFYSLILVGTPFLIYTLLIIVNPHILEVYKLYFENRFGHAFAGSDHNTTGNRFEIMIRLFTELIPMLILIVSVLLLHRKYSEVKNSSINNKQEVLWLLMIGFSGSLPLMSTLEQRGFYLLTSLPMFALAGAVMIGGSITSLVNKIDIHSKNYNFFKWLTLLLLVGSIAFTGFSIGKTKRDKEMLSDVYLLGKYIPRGETVGIPIEMWNIWNFQTYMVRYNYISLEASDKPTRFFVIEKTLPVDLVPKTYVRSGLKTEYLDLYVRSGK